MERVRRRFWTLAVSGVAVLVISGAIISGLFQLAVLALPSYRDDLSSWVTQVANRPVQIGGVNLVWRGFAPQLDLSNITLFSAGGDEALTAERLSLGFSLLRLLTGDVVPTKIELSGLTLAVDIDADGHMRIAGFDSLREASARPREDWLRDLSRFEKVSLRNCEVQLRHARLGARALNFTLLHAQLDRTAGGFEAEGDLRLPVEYGESASFSAEIDGDIASQRDWAGEFTVEAASLVPQAWLERWLAPGSRIEAQELNLRLDGELHGGGLSRLELQLDSGATLALRGGRSVSTETTRIEATLAPQDDGWHVSIDDFRFDDEEQLRGALRYRATPGDGYELDADAELVKLTRLAPWLALWRDTPVAVATIARAGGDAQALVLRWRHQGAERRFAVRASLREVSLRADRHIGFSGLSGELTASETGGRFELAGGPLTLQLPAALRNAVPFDTLTGTAAWKRASDGWQIGTEKFGWKAATTQGNGRLGLLLPDDPARSPELDLAATFSADDATAVKPYMPEHWGAGLKGWLNRAIERGRVPRGQLRIRGPLADFPFERRRTGEWRLDLDARDVRLQFAEGWPTIDPVDAQLQFRGNGLSIASDAATVMGTRAQRVVARFADFGDPLLTVDASVAGEMARFYQFVRASPLKRTLAGLVASTSAAGPASLQLHLDIPVHEVERTQARGTVDLAGVEMFYQGLDTPVSSIRGVLAFDNTGVTAEQLDATFAEVAVRARIEPRAGTAGVVLGAFDFAPNAAGEGASQYLPEPIRTRLAGSSAWRAELPLGVADSALVLSSTLEGTAVNFPRPVGKAAAEATPIRVAIGSDAGAPVRVRVTQEGRLSADIALRRVVVNGPLQTHSINLRLGGGEAPRAQEEGIRISGEVAELDFTAWAGAAASAGVEGATLREAEITAGRVLLGRQWVGPTHARFTPGAQGWRMVLKGAGAEGQVDFERAAGGVLTARLGHISADMETVPDQAVTTAQAPTAAVDPGSWPALDIVCEQLVLGGTPLGRLQLRAGRAPGGLRLDSFALTGGKIDASATGQWRRAEGRSSGDLKLELASTDIASVLRAFKYTPNLAARASHFSADVNWEPAAAGIDWEQAIGTIKLRAENGSLKAVEPGAGRVLGLINFWALPRRLTLDFRDVVNEGLSFDTITGSFKLKDGAAMTDDLQIEAPSLRMEVRGRVGLVARDYDQRVSVYPDVSAGITLGAALLGGPALAVLVMLAQEVLDKPLDQATQMSYRLTGTWDNPKVERVDGAAARGLPPG